LVVRQRTPPNKVATYAPTFFYGRALGCVKVPLDDNCTNVAMGPHWFTVPIYDGIFLLRVETRDVVAVEVDARHAPTQRNG